MMTVDAIDPIFYRETMGCFATGVTVVTTIAGSGIHGMTASAFMSGSLDPPLIVVAVGKKARLHHWVLEQGHFGVSILAENQADLSDHFAGRKIGPLAPNFIVHGRTPVLACASAILTADLYDQADCGDHSLFIGKVLHLAKTDRPPLLYVRGRYASLGPSFAQTKADAASKVVDGVDHRS